VSPASRGVTTPFVNILDGLIELQALQILFIKRLEYLYAEESLLGTVSTARQADELRKPAAPAISPKAGQSGQREHAQQSS
jgi:hypothetical protein